MQKIDLVILFNRLCSLEYEFLKYINKKQGTDSAPIDYIELSEALGVDRRKLYGACKRLVTAGALITDGENVRINKEIFKDE